MISTFIEYFIPQEYTKDFEEHRKAKLTISVFAAIAVAAFGYSIISWLIGFWGGLLSQLPDFIVASLCLYLYKKKINPTGVVLLFLGEITLSIIIAIYHSGGFYSFILQWLILPPVVAILIANRKTGLYSIVIQIITLTVFCILAVYEITPFPIWDTEFPVYFYYSCYFGLGLLLFVIATVLESGRLNAMRIITLKNRKLESLIEQLENTQQQLIQQEKLASLGQLTAGIAHEMKNPLNFVNNFSDVSVELIEEIKEELSGLSDQLSNNDSTRIQEVNALLDDVEKNLNKIHEHGTRADSVVKSMLQHSRDGSGIRQLANLNDIVKEYVNLSFHGMRAGSHPINVDIQYDLDEDINPIELIIEDFSRVIINLCNNAFDAMRTKLETEHFKPILKVSTKKLDDALLLEIEDNGPGIPDHIKDKILQPFFTTKKGTEGTGLGLSITNDIINAHNGTLAIVSEVNTFTRFQITLNKLG